MRILIVGDMHGDVEWGTKIPQLANKAACEMIWQVGDFGYWPRQNSGIKFLQNMEKSLADVDIPLWFVDGNHEDHFELRKRGSVEPRELSSHIVWMPRGYSQTIANIKVLFFGGAVSMDRYARQENTDWFREEIPTYHEWDLAYAAGKVDVVIAHEAPASSVYKLPTRSGVWPQDLQRAASSFREGLRGLSEEVAPTYWFAGHHHARHAWQENNMTVNIVGANGSDLNMGTIVFDTEK